MTQATAVPRPRLSVAEAATYLGVSEKTIRRAISSGQLSAYRVTTKAPKHRERPGVIRIRPEDLDALMTPIPTASTGTAPCDGSR